MILQKFWQISLSSFCILICSCSKPIFQQKSTILTMKLPVNYTNYVLFIYEIGWKLKHVIFSIFLSRSSIISRMVYMDSGFFSICIRNAIGGACDEVWQYAILWFMGLQLRIQKWGFDQVINIWNVKIMCIRQFQLKYKCTSIIKTKNNSESGWSCRTWLLSDWY